MLRPVRVSDGKVIYVSGVAELCWRWSGLTGIRGIERRAHNRVQPLRLHRCASIEHRESVVGDGQRHKEDAEIGEGVEHESDGTHNGTDDEESVACRSEHAG